MSIEQNYSYPLNFQNNQNNESISGTWKVKKWPKSKYELFNEHACKNNLQGKEIQKRNNDLKIKFWKLIKNVLQYILYL